MFKIFDFIKSKWTTISLILLSILALYSGICTYVIFSKSSSVSRTESDLRSAREELNKLAADVGIAQTDYTSVSDGIKKLEGTISELKSTNSELAANQQRLTDAAAKSADDLRTENKQLTEQLGSANTTVKILSGSVTELRSTNSKLAADNKRLEEQFGEAAGKLQQYNSGIADSSSKIDEGLGQVSDGLDRDNETISKSIELVRQLRGGYQGTSKGK